MLTGFYEKIKLSCVLNQKYLLGIYLMNVTNRLIFQNSSCLLMQPCLTEKLGKSPAIFLQQLHYWLTSKKDVGRIAYNKRWVYNTSDDWAQQLYMSARQIRRIIQELKDRGIILIRKLSRKKSDRTNWYTINYESLKKLLPSLSWTEAKSQIEATTPTIEETPSELTEGKNHQTNTEEALETKMALPLGHNVLMYIESEITTKTYPKKLDKNRVGILKNSQVPIVSLKNDLAQKLLDIWNQKIGSKTTEAAMTKHRACYLVAAFKFKFNSCLNQWKDFCQSIAASQFLTRDYHQKYTLSLEWVLKFDNLQRIKEGQFGVNKVFFTKTEETTVTKESFISTYLESSEQEIFSKLIDGIGIRECKSWFHNTKPQIKRTEQGNLVFLFSNNFVVDYVKKHFGDVMERILGTKVTIGRIESSVEAL